MLSTSAGLWDVCTLVCLLQGSGLRTGALPKTSCLVCTHSATTQLSICTSTSSHWCRIRMRGTICIPVQVLGLFSSPRTSVLHYMQRVMCAPALIVAHPLLDVISRLRHLAGFRVQADCNCLEVDWQSLMSYIGRICTHDAATIPGMVLDAVPLLLASHCDILQPW